MKLGDGKGSKTGNEIDKLRELRKKNYKFKRNIKHCRRRLQMKMMKETIMMNLKMMLTNLEGRSIRRSPIKTDY